MESLAVILPIIACGSVVFVTGLSLYFKIRHKFPIRVNCWFCSHNTDVPYGNRNCWDCPNCEQYNGFLPDGSYNKAIPAQHDELLNHPVHAVSNPVLRKKPAADVKGNGLCRKCNINQELKVQQLAVFTPVNPARYDEEVDEYRRHLERTYRLCSSCEDVLKQTLHKQKSMLLGFRLKQLRTTSLRGKSLIYILKTRFFQMFSSLDYVIRYFIAMLAAWFLLVTSFHLNKGHFILPTVMQNSTIWSFIPYTIEVSPHLVKLLPVTLTYEIPLTAVGIVIQLAAAIIPKKHARIDIISVSLWVLLHIQCWLKKWKKLEKFISLLDFSISHVVVAFITLLVCTCGALVPRKKYSVFKSHNIGRKTRIPVSSSDSSLNISNNSDDDLTNSSQDSNQKDTERVNGDSSLENSHKEDVRLSSPLKPEICGFYPITNSSSNRAAVSPCTEQSPFSVSAVHEDDNSDDLGRGFGNLTLGSSSCGKWVGSKMNSTSSFETKVYGQNNSSGLFDGSPYNNLRNRKRPIIRPSQLNLCKNITQSSWVAGGYWQSPIRNRTLPVLGNESPVMLSSAAANFAPLSRSSSQSSGFVSQSSQPGIYDGVATSLPNSRTGSICGADFDRFSALSEPIYPYATTPLYFAGARPGTLIGAPFYGGPPVFLHPAYSVVPPASGFMPHYGSPLPTQPQPILSQAQCYYPSQPTRPLGSIWNPSAFTSLPFKQTTNHVSAPAVDVLSQSSSQNSNESHGSLSKSSAETLAKRECVATRRGRTFVSAVQENLFLTILFFSSLLFNALILGGVMLGNSNMLLPGIL